MFLRRRRARRELNLDSLFVFEVLKLGNFSRFRSENQEYVKIAKVIEGVQIFEVQKNADNRGFLAEAWESSKIADFTPQQMNFTIAHPKVIKAFHFHEKQQDYWFCVSGNIEAVLFDRREGSPTFGETQTIVLGEQASRAILIPVGVAHGYRVLGEKEAGLIYLVDREYDSANPDEQRIPFDDPKINFNWQTLPR